MKSTETKPKRPYRLIDKNTISRFVAEKAIQGNGTRAIEVLEQGYEGPEDRAVRIARKSNEVVSSDYVDKSIERIAVGAINRVEEMVYSTDERIATKNAHFILEQHRGKAVQKTESHNVNLNIESVLA